MLRPVRRRPAPAPVAGAILQRPATKITVLPAIENWPLPPLHHSSSVASPLSQYQRREPLRSGLTRRVQCHLQPKRELVIGASRMVESGRCQHQHYRGLPQNLVTKSMQLLELFLHP